MLRATSSFQPFSWDLPTENMEEARDRSSDAVILSARPPIVPRLDRVIEMSNDKQTELKRLEWLNMNAFYVCQHCVGDIYKPFHTGNLIDMVGSNPCWESVKNTILTHPNVDYRVREYLKNHWEAMEMEPTVDPDLLYFLEA
jgi:hypothetical protein